MFKKLTVLALIVMVLIVGAAAVYAQGGRGQGGNGGQGGGGSGAQGGGQQYGKNGQSRQGQNGTQGGGLGGLYTNLPPAYEGELPQEIIDLMIAGWTDEQHAYAVYESVIAQFGAVRPFTNIQNAEVQHAAAWEFLFQRYGIDVPTVPTFDIPQFASLAEACALGAEAEVANFGLYDQMVEAFAQYPDIAQIAQALRDASEFQHLPAFQTCAGI